MPAGHAPEHTAERETPVLKRPAAHLLHATLSFKLYSPPPHPVQLAEPFALLNWPAGQLEQVAEPVGLYLPATHSSTHAALLPASPMVPAAQAMQTACFEVGWYRPLLHNLHPAADLPASYLPAGHSLQLACASRLK